MIDTNPLKPPVILLVEDNTFDAKLIQAALDRTPGTIDLIRVDDGDKAVDYLAGTAPYDDRQKYPVPVTMLLDIKLPKRSGFEVLQWLRSQEGPVKRLPTLMLTSSKHQVDINQAFERGANAYLTKPDSIKELTALLGELKSFWLKRVEFPEIVR
ncbi:MAG TPA: response regulator [Candidatus Angelobacter sp.]|jgi:CheY-like chemotaxis protein|nr:response regulator [Candidatus Angelobacter sp.]